jgi:hypothetical protein
MVLSFDSNLHRHPQWQFAPTPSAPFDSQGSQVISPGLAKMLYYMSKSLAESTVLIGSTVLSNDSNSHRHFASIAPGRFDFEGSVVRPPWLALVVFHMPKKRTESAVSIGSTVLSIASNLHRHRSANSHLHPPHPWFLKEALSDLRGLIKCYSIYLKASLKLPY